MKGAYVSKATNRKWPKNTQLSEMLQNHWENQRFALAKKLSTGKSYVYQETFKNVGKTIVSCNLSAVRGTQSPEGIEYTTLGFRLSPSKTLEIHAFLAAPACRPTGIPAEALVSRAKSYVYLKTFKNLGKTCFSPVASRSLQKETETGEAEVSLGLVGRDKLDDMKCNKTKHDSVLP